MPSLVGRLLRCYRVRCGACLLSEEHIDRDHKYEAIRDLEEMGWKFTRSHGWICRSCDRLEKPR